MKRAAVLSLLALSFASGSAEARLPHKGVPQPTNAPVLQAVTVPLGINTPTGRGGVFSAALDVTTTSIHPVTYSGLGLMSPTAPACGFWYWSWFSNSAGRTSADWTLAAPGTASASALTPVPTSTGNQNLAGNTVFNVYCTDATGLIQSNTVAFTYTPDLKTATVGTSDNTGSGVTPGTWGNIAGQRITLAVGASRQNLSIALGNYTNQVTITPADTARRPKLTQLGAQGAFPSNLLFTDWVLSGSLTSVPTNVVIGVTTSAANAVHDIIFDKIKFYGSEAMLGSNTAQGAIGWPGTNGGSCGSNCILQDSEFNYVESGIGPSTNATYLRTSLRYVYNNCIFITNKNNILLQDVKCLAPMQRPGGVHPDMMQMADGYSPGKVGSPIIIQRFLASTADGDYFAQGPYFGGSTLSAPGYVDDGTGAHGPGNIFTRTGGGLIDGVTIAIPGFVSASAQVTISCISSCASQATLVGLSPTNIGNSGSPITLYSTGTQDFQMSGIMSSQGGPYGTSQRGNAGSSWLYDYDYTILNSQNPLVSTFDGEIVVAGTLTSYSTAVSSVPNETGFIGGGGRLNFPGCNYCFNGGVGEASSGTRVGPGTYPLQNSLLGTVARQTMQISGVYGGQAAPYWVQSNCDKPDVQAGTLTVDRGTMLTGYGPVPGTPTCTVGVNFPASNTTIGSHAFGATFSGYTPSGGNVSGVDYASGILPEAYLAAYAFTAADTPDKVELVHCLAFKPSLGGKRDAGSGLAYGSVTPATNVNGSGGGDLMYFNGTSHVSGRHVAGCEAIP